jgi:putative acetyltransferase
MRPIIRPEAPADVTAIHAVNLAAFQTGAEARLVDALRDAGRLALSLVAAELESGQIIGHVAFSAVTLTAPGGAVCHGMGLAPMAVLPAHQRRGVGGLLVREGLRRLEAGGHPFCVVLGHPDYYPRFGFVPASRHGLRWERDAPEGAFMVRALWPERLDRPGGVVRYASEFALVEA